MKPIIYPLDTRGLEVDIDSLTTHLRGLNFSSFFGISVDLRGNVGLVSIASPTDVEYISLMYEANLYLDTLE